MAAELPYLASYKNVEELFKRIKSAKQPDAFTHKFLYDIIGLKSVGDRSLIPLLRLLGFLDSANKPAAEYASLKNDSQASRALANAIRHAYAPLYAANENAHKLPTDQLRGLIAQVSGADSGTTTKILGTLNSILRLADFSEEPKVIVPIVPGLEKTEKKVIDTIQDTSQAPSTKFRPEFHYNIQVHLPANGNEDTYLNIFNALRRVFK